MPIYEYVCRSCGKSFDHLWTSMAAAEKAAQSGEGLPCPVCQSSETGRIVSQVAVLGELGGLTPGEQRGVNAQAERIDYAQRTDPTIPGQPPTEKLDFVVSERHE